ncbi:MAG: hypothetical protein ABIN79_11845 [Marmoricola sp.]
MRVYLPTSLEALATHLADGGIGPSPLHGHAVTEWLRAEWPDGSEDEWEYAVLMAAADDSRAWLPADARPRRVVLVAEVEGLTEDRDSTGVVLDSAVPLRLLLAVHADTEDLDPAALDPGDLGWFAVQEIEDLIG